MKCSDYVFATLFYMLRQVLFNVRFPQISKICGMKSDNTISDHIPCDLKLVQVMSSHL